MKRFIPLILSLALLLTPVMALAAPQQTPREVSSHVVTGSVEQMPQQNGCDVTRVEKKTYHEFSDGSETIDVEATYTMSAPEVLSNSLVTPMGSNSVVTLTCGFSIGSGQTTNESGTVTYGYRITSYWARAYLLDQNYQLTELNYSASQGSGSGFPTVGASVRPLGTQSHSALQYTPSSGTQYSKTPSGLTNFYLSTSVLHSYATVYYKLPTGSTISFSASAQG